MRLVPRPLRTLLVAGLTLAALPGCEDDRGDPLSASTEPLDGDALFGVAVISAEFFRAVNHFAETALDLFETAATLPVSEPGCSGAGTATITANGDADPATFAVTFSNYVVDCGAVPLTFNTDPTVGGKMVITFRETSPGLVFDVSLPIVGIEPRGVTLQLPSSFGSVILAATTPFGPLLYELDGPRAGLRHEGFVHLEGTLRMEDRTQPLLVVEELDLEYAFDDDLIPKFSSWPGGTYEIAGFGGGGFGFGGATAGAAVNVFFDGLGGAAYGLGDRTCEVNLTDPENGNPCEGL